MKTAVKKMAIEQFANFIVGGSLFRDALRIATALMDRDLSGEEKRETALGQLEIIGQETAGFLINLAIELAVAWLRTQAEKKS